MEFSNKRFGQILLLPSSSPNSHIPTKPEQSNHIIYTILSLQIHALLCHQIISDLHQPKITFEASPGK
jgi:hypothetical protein